MKPPSRLSRPAPDLRSSLPSLLPHLSKGWHALHQCVRRRCDRPVGAGRSAAHKVRLVPLNTWSPVDILLHRQAEPSADLESGQGPVEPDGSTLHPGGGGSPA
jgi:hypothetical protein